MSGNENAAEELVEIVQEKIEKGHGHGERPPWTEHAAMATLVIGVLSALAATLSGVAANEATLRRVHETIDVVEQRGDRTELAVLEARHDILRALDQPPPADEAERVAALRADMSTLAEDIDEEERTVARSLEAHEILLGAITLFSVAITMTGMSLMTRRRLLWRIGLVLGGLGGLVFLWGASIYL